MSDPRSWARRAACDIPIGVWLLAGTGLLAAVMAVVLGRFAFQAHRQADHVQGPPALSQVVAADPSPAEENEEQALVEELRPSAGDVAPPGIEKGILRTERSKEALPPRELKAKPEPSAKPTEKPAQATARPKQRTEEELRKQLLWAPEIALRQGDILALGNAYDTSFQTRKGLSAAVDIEPTVVLSVRPDLANLPFLSGPSSHASYKVAQTLTELSARLRAYLQQAAPKDAKNQRPDPVLLREVLRVEKRGKRAQWLRPEVVPVLLQLLMHEDRPIRKLLVELLAEIEGRRATVALAQRAVFDLAPDVRGAAIEALASRPRQQYRWVLITGLSYPWSAAAEHAAEALVALRDSEAVPQLVNLLDKPDPGLPSPPANNRIVIREVVRINHQNNCLICHPPALTKQDPVLGLVPGVTFHGSLGGGGGYGRPSPQVPFTTQLYVRADFVFFRQDFSVQLPLRVLAGTDLSTDLRYDFLVRIRSTSPEAVKKMPNLPKPGTFSEQRQALLWALRELTGKDGGTTYAQWRAALPSSDSPLDIEADALCKDLLRASPARQMALIVEYRDKKGVVYSEALARAIQKLHGNSLVRAREALAERLTRMTAATLRNKLQEDRAEIRRAAIIACADKGEKALIPDLIGLLKDPDSAIVQLAHRSLKTLTSKDFGPNPNASDEETSLAVVAWKVWWQEQGPARQELVREP
jgi:HEAT repeat protein